MYDISLTWISYGSLVLILLDLLPLVFQQTVFINPQVRIIDEGRYHDPYTPGTPRSQMT